MAQKKQKAKLYIVRVWQDGEDRDHNEPDSETLLKLTPAQKKQIDKLLNKAVDLWIDEYYAPGDWTIEPIKISNFTTLMQELRGTYIEPQLDRMEETEE